MTLCSCLFLRFNNLLNCLVPFWHCLSCLCHQYKCTDWYVTLSPVPQIKSFRWKTTLLVCRSQTWYSAASSMMNFPSSYPNYFPFSLLLFCVLHQTPSFSNFSTATSVSRVSHSVIVAWSNDFCLQMSHHKQNLFPS